MCSYNLKCKCGAFQATFTNQPRLVFNCHCHSCVAASRCIESKEGFNGTSIKSDENGGAALCIWKSNNVAINRVDPSKIDFVKVGDAGKLVRPYCTECKTVLFIAFFPTWCAPNRNALVEAESGKAFEPVGEVLNINAKHAFDESAVPNPKHATLPFGMLFKFIPLIIGLIGDGSNANEKALIPEDMSKVEVVPITWE